ncbi:MAG: hypothetical protein K940chlam8_00076 [Chlamydiae bacterium]|nr:hypothetical protein [Chlamydiota bacterium]
MSFYNVTYIPSAALTFSSLTTGTSFFVPKKVVHLKMTHIALAALVGGCGFCIMALILENRQMKEDVKRKINVATGALTTTIPFFLKKTSFKNTLVASMILSCILLYLTKPTQNKKTGKEES